MLVAEQLDLNVARALDELLDEHAVIAEGRKSFPLGRLEAVADVLFGPRQPHPLAAAAGAGLHHHREADLGGDTHRRVGVGDLPQIAGDDVDARRLGKLLRFDLVAHRGDRVRRRADEGDPGLGTGAREALAFGEEAVAGVDAVCARLLGGEQDQIGLQIAVRRRCRPEPHRLVRHQHVRAARIGVRIDRDGGDAHLLGGAEHPARDLAAVGDQDLLEQRPLLFSFFVAPAQAGAYVCVVIRCRLTQPRRCCVKPRASFDRHGPLPAQGRRWFLSDASYTRIRTSLSERQVNFISDSIF